MWYWLFKYIFMGLCCRCSVVRKSKGWTTFRTPAR